MISRSELLLLILLGALPFSGTAADQPQWGQAWSRNMVSDETALPESFDLKTGEHVKWSARLGTQTHSTPIVARGRVYIGTNNGEPRDPKEAGDRGVLMCFDEETGGFLWQLAFPKREEDPYFDWPQTGISSPVTVDGDRVYLVNNRGEVLCFDAGKGDSSVRANEPSSSNSPRILWLFNLTTGAGIWSHDAAHSSILVNGDYLYLNTGTGVDNTHKRIRTPDAPSLVVLDKKTGRLVARDNEGIAPNIFHSTWASPSLAEVNGRSLIFFAAGNGILYAFNSLERSRPELGNPGTASGASLLQKVWQFDFDPEAPKTSVHQYNSNRREGPSNFYGMPVFYQNRIYVAGGGDLWWGKNEAWLKCIDATGTGNVTSNALIWTYPLQKHVLSTAAIYRGMIFIADCGRGFHCLNIESGKPFWTQDIEGEAWASPLVADGRVYLGTRSGMFYVFAASRGKKLLSKIEMGNPISATATAANGVLYVATMTQLFALRK